MTELHMISNKHSKKTYKTGETMIIKARVSARDFKVGYKMCGKLVALNSKGEKVWKQYQSGPIRKCWSGLVKARKL